MSVILFKKLNVLVLAAVAVAFFIGGWTVNNKYFSSRKEENEKPMALRLGGYKYTSPLLLCDANSNKQSVSLNSLKNRLQNVVNNEIKNKNITTASIYFRDLKSGGQVDINSDEKFYPSSLRKVPLMIAVFKAAEANPGQLDKLTVIFKDPDQNIGQEIKPADFAKKDKTYTLSNLLEKMVKYSDNNATFVFTNLLGIDSIKTIYNDLQVPFLVPSSNSSSSAEIDFMTTNKFAFFFRILYNSTYLNGDLSEKALKLLTDTDFKDGLVAGVPQGTVVAHKFGLTSLGDKHGNIASRELHDCGIVYYPDNPYLVCVMTKSTADIPHVEKTISNISAAAYQEFTNILKNR
ncbi:MAG TPA: serine hydrolase [Candidatus Udaeobacter sp.]|nr:serine hydrolase [Candidatus Udaeobacter sp.]